MQNEYQQYLLAETAKTETALLNASATNINSMLRDAVMTGADIAVDSELYKLVKNVDESDGALRDTMRLNVKLNNITHYNNIIAATTVVTEGGLLWEYGRYWDNSGYNDLWRDDNLEILWDLYVKVMERTKDKSAVNYEVSTTPLIHEDFPNMIFFHLAYPLVGSNVQKTNSCGVVVFTMRLDLMIQSSALSGTDQGDYISEYITDENGTVLYHRDSDLLGENERHLGTEYIEELEMPLDYMNWLIHIDIDTSGMRRNVQNMLLRAVGVYLILLLSALWCGRC